MAFHPVAPPIVLPSAVLGSIQAGLNSSAASGAAVWLQGCLATDPTTEPASSIDPQRIRGIVVLGDTAIGRRTPELVSSAAEGAIAAVRETAASLNIQLDVLDETLLPELSIASACGDQEDALTTSAYEALVAAGIREADRVADSGVQLVLLGAAGAGLSTAAATVVGAVRGVEPTKIVGWGAGISDEGWKLKVAAIRDAMFRVRDDRSAASRVLQRASTPVMVFLTAFMAQCAARRTAVVFDGVAPAAAGLCAHMLAPGAAAWFCPAATGTEPAIAEVVQTLEMRPIWDGRFPVGAGIHALLAWPMLAFAMQVQA